MNLREWALPVYTILMQLSTGALLAMWILRSVVMPVIGREETDRLVLRPTAAIFCTALVAVLGAHFHLSRPILSFLAVLNLRSSWLSREIFLTALFFLALAGLVALQWSARGHSKAQTLVGWVAVGLGTASILCMAQIYRLPTQTAWDSPQVVVSFYATTLLLGAMAAATFLVLDARFSEMRGLEDRGARFSVVQPALIWLARLALVMMVALVVLNVVQISRQQYGDELSRLSLQLLLGLYRPLFALRLGLLLVGVAWMVMALWIMQRRKVEMTELVIPTYMACLLILVGEIMGRFLFYATHIRLGI